MPVSRNVFKPEAINVHPAFMVLLFPNKEIRPEFFSTPSDFRVVLKNINYNLHTTAQDSAQDERITKLIEFCSVARTRDEIQEHLGISSREYLRKNVLKPLLKAGQLEMTIPNKPNSKYQKYITSSRKSATL